MGNILSMQQLKLKQIKFKSNLIVYISKTLSLICYFLVIFFIFYQSSYAQAGELQATNCSLVQIHSKLSTNSQKNYSLSGQGWVFKDERTIPHKLYILTPAHVVFGATTIQFQCPDGHLLNETQTKVKIVGISPTYDLAVLEVSKKIVPSQITPLFTYDGTSELKKIVYPNINRVNSMKIPIGSAFFWVENQKLNWASGGTDPGLWPKTYSILPYRNEFNSLNGVKPGMSGSLLMALNPTQRMLGMTTKTLINGPYSVSLPIEEIIEKLPFLISGIDPRKSEAEKHLPFVDFELKPNLVKNEELQRIRSLKIKNSNDEIKYLAEDSCPAGLLTPVSSWQLDTSGGGSIADGNGGGTIADGSGGGSVSDSNHSQTSSTGIYSPTHGEFTQSNTGKLLWNRSVYFTNNTCSTENIKWFGNSTIPRLLYGLSLQPDKIIRINSVTDLFRLNWKNLNLRDIHSFISFIETNGIFIDQAQFDSNSNHSIKTNPLSFLCQNYSAQPYFIAGYKYLNSSGFASTDIGILGKEARINYASLNSRIFEDTHNISLNETVNLNTSFDDITSGYSCAENEFNLMYTNTFYNTSDIGYSYSLRLFIKNNRLTLRLKLFNGYDPNKVKEPLLLKLEDVTLNNIWTQSYDIDGFKIELRFDPEYKTIFVGLTKLPDSFNSNDLIRGDHNFDSPLDPSPLKLVRLLYFIK